MRHPRSMGAGEVEAFLNMLANERKVSASTHNQALSAILFLYREVLGIYLPWLDGVNRSAQKRCIRSVLTKAEVSTLFNFLDGNMRLLAQLLYSTGTRMNGAFGRGGSVAPKCRLRPVARRRTGHSNFWSADPKGERLVC